MSLRVLFCQQRGVHLPCNFKSYDVNNDGIVGVDEFMNATMGYTKVSPKVIFDRIDINRK